MSYEKSTRPDGSFKDDGSTSGSSQDSVLKALSHTPAIQTASPTANHPDHKYGSNQPSNDDQEDQSLPAQSDQTSSGKALSGPKKHAVQKAIAMSQYVSSSAFVCLSYAQSDLTLCNHISTDAESIWTCISINR